MINIIIFLIIKFTFLINILYSTLKNQNTKKNIKFNNGKPWKTEKGKYHEV